MIELGFPSSNLLNSNLGVSTTLNWNQSKFIEIRYFMAQCHLPECHGFCPGNRVALSYKGFLTTCLCGCGVGYLRFPQSPGPVEAGTYAAKGGARTGPP